MQLGGPLKKNGDRWANICPQCGTERLYTRMRSAKTAASDGSVCRSCARSNENPYRFHRGIRETWFNIVKAMAARRNIKFEITIDDVADMYEKQNGECALSGWRLTTAKNLKDQTISIDRIDSSKGYSLDNIQLVHKHINLMKHIYSVDQYISACKAVTQNMENKNGKSVA